MQYGFGGNGYSDWALELSGLSPDAQDQQRDLLGRAIANSGLPLEQLRDLDNPPVFWEALFVRALDRDGAPLPFARSAEFFKQLYAFEEKGGIFLDPFEIQFHQTLRAEEEPVEIVLFRRFDQRDAFDGQTNELLFEILAIGGIVESRTLPRIGRIEPPDAPPNKDLPVLGIIDDGIASLHGRIRSMVQNTRLEKILWLSTLPGGTQVQTRAEIDAELARQPARSEHDAYREITEETYGPTTRHSLRQSTSHGAHILDLAAGAEIGSGDPMLQIPILATQARPQSFDDTSGTRLVVDILMGLRWMILETALRAGPDQASELIVNMSLGYLAGPKNGSSFIEQAMDRLIRLAETFLSMRVHIVLPYGNGYSDNTVARSCLAPGQAQSYNLRVQPDDRTPSYLELRLTDLSAEADPERIEIEVTPPRGGVSVGALTLAAGQDVELLDDAGRQIGRLFHVAARPGFTRPEPAYLLLALAPTLRSFSDAELTAPSGLWQVDIRNLSKQSIDVTAQVQRDDNPYPRNVGARQARLEGAETRVWDPVRRSFEGVDPAAGRVTRAGTNSALSTTPHPRAVSVGGALVRQEPADLARLRVEPARYYTAEGADWSGTAPDLSAISETGRALAGVLAAGVSSAETARLSGSSTATATVSRDLVLGVLGEAPLPSAAQGPGDPRLGDRTILDNPAIRRRR